MKHMYTLLAGLLLGAAALIFSFKEESSHDRENPSQEESALKAHLKAYKDAFNQQNAERLASLWTEDAIYVNLSTHDSLQGREEIADYYKDQFSEGKASLEVKIDDIKFESPEKVSETGEASVSSQGKTSKSLFVATLIKENNGWLLQKVTEVDVQPPPSHYEKLKDLEWLIGTWESKNDNMKFSSVASWSMNKNFITVKFSVVLLDKVNFEGFQVIAWDPFKEKIRSWIFDSDGGMGEGIWSKQNNTWYVSSVFTLPDGRRATSTNIYTKESDNSMTFASEDRDVDGKVMPNIKPFKINKKP